MVVNGNAEVAERRDNIGNSAVLARVERGVGNGAYAAQYEDADYGYDTCGHKRDSDHYSLHFQRAVDKITESHGKQQAVSSHKQRREERRQKACYAFECTGGIFTLLFGNRGRRGRTWLSALICRNRRGAFRLSRLWSRGGGHVAVFGREVIAVGFFHLDEYG